MAFSLLTLGLPGLAGYGLAVLCLGGRPFFFQQRIGQDETLFTIFKLRTLFESPTGEDAAPGAWRLTLLRRLGALARRTGLDEVPQCVNILRGEMNLFGPRPLLPEDYAELPEGRRRRCRVRPGLTGFAQVYGGQALSPAEKLEADLWFIAQADGRLYLRIAWLSALRLVGLHRSERARPPWRIAPDGGGRGAGRAPFSATGRPR